MLLKVIILVWSLIPFGSAFQVLGADALNDLSPNVTLYRQIMLQEQASLQFMTFITLIVSAPQSILH